MALAHLQLDASGSVWLVRGRLTGIENLRGGKPNDVKHFLPSLTGPEPTFHAV